VSNLFFRNPRLTMLLLGLILVAGGSSYYILPRMEDPILTARFANVNTVFPGAIAERVESIVSERLEDALLEIDEINEVRSISRAGFSAITIELRDDVYEVDEVWSRIRDKVDDAALEFPEGVLDPVFEEQKVKAYALLLGVQFDQDQPDGDSPTGNPAILRRLAEQIADKLRSVSGTEVVDIFGEPTEEITVELQQNEATALGLTATSIAQQLANSDSKLTAGQLRGGSNLPLEVDTELNSIARVGATPIQFGSRGDFVRLADIARVQKTLQEPPSSVAFADGKRSVVLGALVRSDTRVDHWFDRAEVALAAARAQMPQGVRLVKVFDQNNYVRTRLSDLLTNLCLGAVAVMIVIFLMMGWRSAVVVGSALPLSALMVLTGMRLMEIPIHQMSITGLIIALGLLIDNAIVMVDEVALRLEEGDSPAEAVSHSVRMLAIPLLGSTLTTALSFGPIASMPGPAGEFVGAIAINVILAVGSSFFLALTVVPAIAAFVKTAGAASKRWWETGLKSKRLSNWYRSSLPFLIGKPWRGILLSASLPVFGFVQARHLPEQFFPPADRDQFQIEAELPAHASIQQTQAYTTAIRETVLAHPEVTNVSWFLGESAPAFYYNMVASRENQANYGQALVQLKSARGVRDIIRSVQVELDQKFPAGRILVRQLEQGPPFEAPVEVRLFGPDPDVLREIGDDMRLELSRIPHVVHTRSDLSDSLPKLSFKADEEQVRLAGLSNADVARQMQASLEGAVGGSILETTEELPVRVRVANSQRDRIEPIYSTMLSSPNAPPGQPGIPLSSLGQMQLDSEYGSLVHLRGRRMNEVQAYIEAGVLPATVLTAFQSRLAELDYQLPPGYTLRYGGEAAERDSAVGNLLANVGVLVVLMIATLVISFGSFRIAGVIGLVAILSVGLGIGALWVFGFPFGFMAIVGTMGLVGLAINDSIVVLAALRENKDAAVGNAQAVCDVVQRSTPHVVATSITTIAGFLPLIIAGGGFWPPLAVTIAGGVGGATLLALYFVPAVWILMWRSKSTLVHPDTA
jgi:multidrug efflux pump subunit AcrB